MQPLLACRRCIQSFSASGSNVSLVCSPAVSSLISQLDAGASGQDAALLCRSHLAACISTSAPASALSPKPSQQRGRDARDRGSDREPANRREEQAQQQQQQRHSLAMQNAPRKVFELIGDPRTGLADNVTSNPFGEITVDMMHHQLSNEVYWYKYEFAGNAMTEMHRNARLSEHAKNHIYILRAKDPFRWTIDALARKFHVRQQRILAILTLKEMEAHRMESGASMSGPLSGYACPVHMDDVHLDPATAEPIEGRAPSAGPAAAHAKYALEQQLPQLQHTSSQVQLQLLQALQAYGYNLESMSQELVQQVSAIEQQLQHVLPLGSTDAPAAGEEPAEGDAPAAAPSPAATAATQWGRVKSELQALLDCVRRVLGVSDVVREEQALVTTVQAVKDALERSSGAAEGAAGGAGAGEEKKDAAALLEGWEGARLLRLVLELGQEQRKQLLDSVQKVSLNLQSQGVNMEALTSSSTYTPGGSSSVAAGAATTAAAATTPLPLDVLGYRPVGDEVLGELVQRLQALEQALAVLKEMGGQQSSESVKAGGGASKMGSAELQALLELRRSYLSTDSMVAGVYQLKDDRGGPAEERLHKLQVLQEADPTYPARALQYDQVMSMLQQGSRDVALMGLQELEGSEERAQAVLESMQPKSSSTNEFLSPEQVLQSGESVQPVAKHQLHKGSWDVMAAFIDNQVAHKVYHRGSGERHVVRLPTYPAFEGYTLQEFDSMEESELSQLNRKVAQREEEELGARFRSNLFFNLGLVGPDLWDNSQPPLESNPGSTLDKPMVVYGVSKSGETVYPPLKVVLPDGSERPLNEQERVYQERRRPLRGLPYQFQRIRRKTEIV